MLIKKLNVKHMKRTLLSVINVIILSLLVSTSLYAVKHTVNVGNYYFAPATLNVQVGDTIRWVWVQGSHTTTSTTIPAGAPSWDEPMNTNNPVYEYRVSVPGVYNYLCTPHSSTQIGSFNATAVAPTLTVAPSNQSVPASSGSTTFTVTSNSNWTAVSNANWCTVTSSGSGNGTILANYQTNGSTSQRIATITISVTGLPNVTVTVTQAGAAATLTVTPSNQNVTSAAGSTNFSVTSNSNWTAVSNANWCTITSSGSGNGTIIANYQANTTSSQRIATLTISVTGLPNETVTVTQAGTATTLTVSPSNQNVGSSAGSTTFNVLSNSSWTANSNSDWCVVTPSGTGNGTITANYQENMSVTARTATITISAQGILSQIVTVTQSGTETVLIIDPLNQNVTAIAGTTSFSIISNTNWEVTSDSEWASATADGSGNGIILVDYEENTSNDIRVAVLTVVAPNIVQLITITQEGSVAVDNNKLEGLKLFPNPSNGLFEISSDIISGRATLTIFDVKGNNLHSQEIEDISSAKVNLSSAPEGNYFLKIQQDNKLYISKIVITK